MNAVFCHGVLPPDLDWNKNTYSPTKGWKEWLQFVLEQEHDIVMQIPRFPHAHTFMMKYSEWEDIMNSQKIKSLNYQIQCIIMLNHWLILIIKMQ